VAAMFGFQFSVFSIPWSTQWDRGGLNTAH
jgi:hypothetical protein